MKHMYKKISIFLVVILALHNTISAQCGSPTYVGTATNMFTLIRNGTSSIAASKTLNTIAFIHRNNVSSFGGSSGNLRFDYSTDGGVTWTLNQGIINPVNSSYARYPNITIYNPSANTNTANAYISYMAPTINSVSSAWNGEVTGVSQLNASGVTETYNQNGIGTTWQAGSLVNGAPGVFWAMDAVVPSSLTGFNVYKGTWNSTSSDIVWSINYACTPPFNTGYTSSPTISDYNIAFDPTGQIGYFSFLGHVTPGPSNYALYPVLYKTTNGGSTWTGPIEVDLTQFSCISSNTVSPNVPSTNIEHDLVVDVNGNPHLITTLGNASYYNFNYSTWHHMYDITLTNGLWAAYDLGNVNGSPYTFGISPNFATQWQAPQAARTADGTKVFFTWTDNSNYSLGTGNSTPDLFGKAYDVVNNKWTQMKNFSSCNSAISGKITFPHIAPEVLEPTSSTYKLATVYGENTVNNDLGQTANFKFLDNITFASSEFTVTPPAATVTIQQAPLVLICPNTSLSINVAGGAGQALWNTGATTTSIAISSGTATTYSVIAQVGCLVGTASVAVTNLTVNTLSGNPSVCPGSPATFTALGNALGYTWTPGSVTGTNVILNPTVNTITLTTMGSNSCTSTKTLNINLLPIPVITIAGSNTICAGIVLTLTASGAQTYSWSNSSNGATFTDTPIVNTSYTVTGAAANTCTNSQTVSVTVKPSPTITASSSQTASCAGDVLNLLSSGAVSYSLNGVSSTANTTVAPTISTIYTVTGGGTNLCQTSRTLSILVYALPSITITPSRSLFCKGEKINLSATGANSYTWVVQGVLNPSVQVYPTTNTTYSIIGQSVQGCLNTATYALVVSLCTGIEQFEAGNTVLNVYPNPNNGTFTIKGDINLALKIINELGQVVRTVSLNEGNSHEASVGELAAGIYFISGQKDELIIKQKIVVAR
jgi:hypothetical protein